MKNEKKEGRNTIEVDIPFNLFHLLNTMNDLEWVLKSNQKAYLLPFLNLVWKKMDKTRLVPFSVDIVNVSPIPVLIIRDLFIHRSQVTFSS